MHSSVEVPTLKKYSKHVTKFVSFVLRCHMGWASSYQMALTKAQSDECSGLLEHLKLAPVRARDMGADEPAGEPYIDEEEEDSTEMDDEMTKNDSDIPPAVLSSLAEYSKTDTHILDFLSSIFTQLPVVDEGKFYSPIVRFLILEAYQCRGQWLPPRHITEIISVLTFIGRQVMFYQVLKAMSHEQESRFSM